MSIKSKQVSKERLEKAARIYNKNRWAAEALGISWQHFDRLCKKYGIKTPNQQIKEQRKVAKARV